MRDYNWIWIGVLALALVTSGCDSATEADSTDYTDSGNEEETAGGDQDAKGGEEETTDGEEESTGGEEETTTGGEEENTGGEEEATAGGEEEATAGGEEEVTAGGEEEATAGGEEATVGGEEEASAGGETAEGGASEANGCAEIWHCELGCLSGDCACQEGYDAEDAGLVAYAGLADCLDSACPLNNGDCIADEVTFTGKCLSQAEACVPDAAGGTCSDVVSCILDKCEPGNIACEEDCFKGAKLKNHVYGELYAACVQENCDEYPYTEECIQKAKDLTCGTQWSACNNSDF